MQLSKNFHLSELTQSQTASRYGLPNTPNSKQIANLKELCLNLLQPIRDHYGKPLIVSSGYRSPMVNARVGSNGHSQHCLGQAADFEIPGLSNLELARWIDKNLEYDQLILEFYNAKDPNSGWVHCSYGGKRQKENFIFNGKTFERW
jgi:zinc D-Ala-D-Ala carboxypeptidase